MGTVEAFLLAFGAMAVGVVGAAEWPAQPSAPSVDFEVTSVTHDRDPKSRAIVRTVAYGFDVQKRQASTRPFPVVEKHFDGAGVISEQITYAGQRQVWDAARHLHVHERVYDVLALANTNAPERFREVYVFDAAGRHIATEREELSR